MTTKCHGLKHQSTQGGVEQREEMGKPIYERWGGYGASLFGHRECVGKGRGQGWEKRKEEKREKRGERM